MRSRWLLFLLCALLLVPVSVKAQEGKSKEPLPIKILRKGGKPTIPDVARDKVIALRFIRFMTRRSK